MGIRRLTERPKCAGHTQARNGAKSHKARTHRRREITNGARCQTAPGAKNNDAKGRDKVPSSPPLPFAIGAVSDFAALVISRRLAFRAALLAPLGFRTAP